MKKLTQLALVIVLLLSLCGCNAVISDNTVSQTDLTEYDLNFKDEDLDYEYSDATYINLTDEDVKITKAGTYVLTGETSGSIIVDVSKNDEVKLVLDGVTINADDFAAIYVVEADKVTITLAEGSTNYLSDGTTYNQIDSNDVNAVIYSKGDLVINGNGSLEIEANYDSGIISKDDLIITGGTYIINASNGKGIVGKDCVKIKDADITINSLKDAIRSNNDEDDYRGYIYIVSGNIKINGSGDGIYAYNLLQIDSGTFNIVTTSNSNNDSDSLKGLKSDGSIIINSGSFEINTVDDCIHSDNEVIINGGDITISSGDDGIHANVTLQINDGTINILKSYEGIEGQYITVNGGDISVVSSDDGFNAADSSDASTNDANDFDFRGNKGNNNMTNSSNDSSSSDGTTPEIPQAPSGDSNFDPSNQDSNFDPSNQNGTMPPSGQGDQNFDPSNKGGNNMTPPDKPTGDSQNEATGLSMPLDDTTSSDTPMMIGGGMGGSSTDAILTINGGNVYVNAGGDGLDSNGTIVINGGNIVVDGPSDSSNCAFDYEVSGNIYGGEIILVGSSGMAESFSSDSTQCNLLYNLSTTYSAGSEISVLDKDGNEILSMTSKKSFNSLMLSSSKISDGDTITININNDSLTYTFSGICNSSGSAGGMGNGGMGHGGMSGDNANMRGQKF